MKTALSSLAVITASLLASADVPDRTADLEYVACPSASRWTERQKMPVCDLFFHDGKLWVGGGATELNAGPCPLQYIDPATKQVTVECNAGTENITVFKRFSDGRLYVPSQDPRDYDADYDDDGFVFVRNGDNDWTFYKGCAQQQLVDNVSKGTKMGGFVHVWDAEEYDGNVFIGGYGISRSADFGKNWACASTSWKYGKMTLHHVNGVYDFTKKCYKTPTGETSSRPEDGYGTYRRELQFMKFNDRLFAIPSQYVPIDVPTKYYDAPIELHRYNETTHQFYEMTNRLSRVFPDCAVSDLKMTRPDDAAQVIPSYSDLKLWHTTPFSNRVFYVVSTYDSYTNRWGSARKGYKETQYPYPLYACAADPSTDGMFTAKRLDFGHVEEFPFDFLVKGEKMYALTVKYDSTDKKVRHTVWVTTDAKTFTKLFSFKFHQYLISMEYGGGYFYFGAGYKGACQTNYQLDGTADAAGNVYRIAMPQEEPEVDPDEPEVVEPVNVTDKLVLLGNPAKSRWPGSAQSRHVQDLHPYQGKIYTSGGEWGNNTGPCPCFAVDPYSGAYENEFDAGTDAIYEFKEFSDGLLYCSAIDPHEGAANIGHVFRKASSGNWYAYSTCVRGSQSSIKDQGGYPIHNWDITEFKGYTFVCGYGISGSTDWCRTTMFDATPSLKDNGMRKVDGRSWTAPNGDKYNAPYGYSFLRRFTSFLPFDDDLFCVPNQPILYQDIFTWNNWEPWRWDASANQFVSTTNTWADICPGAVESMANFESFDDGIESLQLWHPTKFKNRVLYILGGHDYNITPWAAYSAVDVNHKIKATRIDLGSVDIRPFDLYAAEDAVYLVAAEASKTTTTVTNSIWKSTDGVSFTKLLWFTSTRQASALCYYDGSFYVGMGSNTDILKGWPKVTGADVSGNIYRIPYGEQSIRFECDTAKLSVSEGGSGTARFRLTEKPSANVTAKITTSGAVSTSVKTLTFTASNWNVWQSVAFSVGQDEVTADQKGALVCGGVDGIANGTCMITIVNDDFAEKEVAPAGLVDLTTPNGTFTHDATTGVVTMKPFNDATSDGDTNNRVCVQQKHFSITYEFPSNAMVNAYSIKAMTINSYAERAPSEWKFFASDDNSSWTELDHRRWEIGWKSGELRYHTCANTKYYKYYKIEFLGNNGNEYIQFARLEYYGEFEQSGDKPAFVKGTPIFYEGFATEDYPVSGTGLNNGPTGFSGSVGLSTGKWNTMGSNQPLIYSSDLGLALPKSMTDVGFSVKGGSVGLNPQTNSNQPRGAYHGLADGLLASTPTGKFVFRVLMNADSKAMSVLNGLDTIIESSGTSCPAGNYYGAGFVSKPSGNNYGVLTSQPNSLCFFFKKMKDGSFRAACRAKGADGTATGCELGPVTPGTTYIFYAEVTLRENGDVIRAGYQDVASYSANLPWQGTMTNDIFSASARPDAIAVAGAYGTNGGYFRADEFAIGTKLNDVLFAEGVGNVEPTEVEAPVIGASGRGIALSEDGKTFGVSIKNAKAGLYYTAYVTDDLAKPFVASDVSIRATTDGALMLSIPTSDRPSLFVKVVATAMSVRSGTILE